MICEKCNTEHSGIYGSGRFCSSTCAKGFSTMHSRKQINDKVSKTLSGRAKSRAPKPFESNERRKATWMRKLMEADFDTLGYDAKRRRVLSEQSGRCNKCNIAEWCGMPLSLEMDHIDGDNRNHKRSNLEGLCPNCHSLTSTWRGRNGRPSISETDLADAIANTESITAALRYMNMALSRANYKKARLIAVKYSLLVVVPGAGIEPATSQLSVGSSTTELPGH